MVTKVRALIPEWFGVFFLQPLEEKGWGGIHGSIKGGSCHAQSLGDVRGEKDLWLDDSQFEMLVQ